MPNTVRNTRISVIFVDTYNYHPIIKKKRKLYMFVLHLNSYPPAIDVNIVDYEYLTDAITNTYLAFFFNYNTTTKCLNNALIFVCRICNFISHFLSSTIHDKML